MKIHRFIAPFTTSDSYLVATDKALLWQLNNVLKLKKGEQIILCDNQYEHTAIIASLSTEGLKALVLSKKPLYIPKRQTHLYIPLIKKNHLEIAIQKCVEIGVSSITPIITNRSIGKNIDSKRLNSIVKEAKEQSGNTQEVLINSPLKFKEALIEAKEKSEFLLIADISGESLSRQQIKHKSIALFIGPEGGFDNEEITFSKQYGNVVSLGETTLRAETAAIVSLWYIINQK